MSDRLLNRMAGMMGKIGVFMKNYWLALLIGAAVLGGGTYYYFSSQKAADTTATIQTAEVKRGDLAMTVTGTGQVTSREQVNLRPVVAGDSIEVRQVAVENDQEVKKDDLIAVLDTTDAMKEIRDAQNNLKSAEIKMDQTKRQFEDDTKGDKLNRDAQRVAVRQAQARVSDARDDLQDYYIRAPFSGVVTGLSVAAGDSITREEVLASVITKEMFAKVVLNEVDAASVKNGQAAHLTFDALGGEMVNGTVTNVDTIGTIQQNVVSYTVEIEFDQPAGTLKPGMSVDVEILIAEKKNVLLVPNAAVKSDERGKYVLVPKTTEELAKMADQPGTGPYAALTYRPQRVETGLVGEAMTEIVSGLTEGATVITRVPSTTTTAAGQGTGAQSGNRTGGSSLIPFGSGRGAGLH